MRILAWFQVHAWKRVLLCCLLWKGRTAVAATPCTPGRDRAICWARGLFYVIHCDATRGRGICHHQTSSGSICQPGPVFTCSQPAAPCLIVCQSAPLFLRPLVCCYLPHSSYILHCLSAFIISFSYCSNIQNKPSTWCLKISLNRTMHTMWGNKELRNGVDD